MYCLRYFVTVMENLKTYIVSITSVTKRKITGPVLREDLIQEKNTASRKRLRNDAGIRKWG